MRIELTDAEIAVLHGANRGSLFARRTDDGRTVWRVQLGRVVNRQVASLLERGLIRQGAPLPEGHIPSHVTRLGAVVLDAIGGR